MNLLRRLYLPLVRYVRDHSDERRRHQREDFLKALYHYGSCDQNHCPIEAIRCRARLPKERLSTVVGELVLEGLIEVEPLRLTARGQEVVLPLIRAHRIYEKYLAEQTGYTPDEWHDMAEIMEHRLSPKEKERIASLLRNPLWDPHGDPIPTAGNALPQSTPSVQVVEIGSWYRVIHVEDDEAELYKQVNRCGLGKGSVFRLSREERESVYIYFEGTEVGLPKAALQCLNLDQLSEHSPEVQLAEQTQRLSTLQQGETAEIVGISPTCLGAMRRRLLDLGFVRGSFVSIDMRSPMGNPTAYVVRHTAIALRQDQAKHILVRLCSPIS